MPSVGIDVRDATMILVAYRHGLRASELLDLGWDQIDFNTATLAVRRTKNGSPSTHPIKGDELSALRPNMSASAAITLRCVEVLPCRRNRLNAGRVGSMVQASLQSGAPAGALRLGATQGDRSNQERPQFIDRPTAAGSCCWRLCGLAQK
jgi:hypothetical protein